MSVREDSKDKAPLGVPWFLVWLLVFYVVPPVAVHYTTVPHTQLFLFLSEFTKGGIIDVGQLHELLVTLATVSATLWVIVFAVLTLSAGMLSPDRPPVQGIPFGFYFSSRSLYWLLANSEIIAVCFQTTMFGSLMLLIPALPARSVSYFALILLLVNICLSVYRYWLQPVIASDQKTLSRDLDAATDRFAARTDDIKKRGEIIQAAKAVLDDFAQLTPAKQKRSARPTAIAFVEALSKLDSEDTASKLRSKDEIIAEYKAAQERLQSEGTKLIESGQEIEASLRSIQREYGQLQDTQKILNQYSSDLHRDLVRFVIFLLTFRLVEAPSGMVMLLLLGACLVMGIIMSLRTGFGIVSAAARTR